MEIDVPYMGGPPPNTKLGELVLDQKTPDLYHYTNLARCAAIFNHLFFGIVAHDTIADIFNHFVDVTNPTAILDFFTERFEEFMYTYLRTRFGPYENIKFHQMDQVPSMSFPINIFIENMCSLLVVTFSRAALARLVGNIKLFFFLYDNNDGYIRAPHANDSNWDWDASATGYSEDEYRQVLNKISTDICIEESAETLYQYHTNDAGRYDPPERELIDVRFCGNGPQFFNTNTTGNQEAGTCPDIRIIERQVHANLSDIWTARNKIHLSYLTVISVIMETAIQPVLNHFIDQNPIDGKPDKQTHARFRPIYEAMKKTVNIKISKPVAGTTFSFKTRKT